MAKVFVVVPLELHPGVNGEDFEKFWIEEYAPIGLRLGVIGRALKADRGERAGKYAMIWEWASVESRDRVFPPQGQISEEGLRLLGPDWEKLSKKLNTFITGWPNTDYVEIGKQ
jgi:hypothetical protein